MLKQRELAERPAGLSHRSPTGKRGPVTIALATAILFAGQLPPLHAHIASQPEAGKQRLAPFAGTAAGKSSGTLRQRLTSTTEATPIAGSILYFGLLPANEARQVTARAETSPAAQSAVTDTTKESAAAAEAPTAPQANPADEARAFAEHWARAWSDRDFDAYLAAYGKGFIPEKGVDRTAWEQSRRQKIEGRKSISVSLRDLKIDVAAEDRLEVRFLQDYVADSFRESGTPKLLVLTREDGAWRIVGETTESTQVARK